MVRDKIKHGDLKITHHKNSLVSSYLGKSNATYVDDHNNNVIRNNKYSNNNSTIFTITHHPSQQNLTTCTSSNSVSSQGSNSSSASTETKTSRLSDVAPPANLSVSSSRIHLSSRNSLPTNNNGHAIVKKYSKRSYLNRPLILIPLIVITTLVLLALVAFIVYAVISTTRQVSETKNSGAASIQQQKEQDIGFLVRKNVSVSSSSTASNAAQPAAQRPPSASLSNSDYDTSKNFYIRPPTYASELCGIQRSPPNLQQTRIVNGYPAMQNSWPWTVSMGYFGPRASLPHACGGTLINRRFVITATHCVQEKSIYNLVGNPIAAIEQYSTLEKMLRVYVGVTSRSKDISHATTYRVAKIIMHPNFDASTFKNDLAILQLDQDVMLSDSVGYICVNPETNTLAGTDLFAVGWGFTEKNFFSASDTLNQVKIQIQTQATCGLTYIPVIQFCAGNPSLTKDTCNGDSGGPVMQLNEDKKWRLVGVVSNGDAACTGRGIYTNISFYYDWINANTILS